MTAAVIFLHTIIAIFLIIIVLMQSGRGGGLTESFVSAESMFGAKTNEMLIKITTVLATLYIMTCLGLAFLSSKKSESLMSTRVTKELAIPTPQAPEINTVPVSETNDAPIEVPPSVPQSAPEAEAPAQP